MTDNKNTILAIVLSALVLIGWQFFFAMPQEKARQEQLQAQQQKQGAPDAVATGPDAAGTRTIRHPADSRSGGRALGRRSGQSGCCAGRLTARADRDR